MKNGTVKFALLLSAFILFIYACSKEKLPIPQTITFEQNLSAYNIYQGTPNELTPSDEFHLLEMSSALFSNYTEKQRLVKLPTGTQLTANGNGLPVFPNGTILVKTFYYFNDERDQTLGKQIIETRLLIKNDDVWNVASYIWNEAQTDAIVALDGFDTQVSWIDQSGTNKSISYHFPNQDECIACHQTDKEVLPLGPTLRNLNFLVNRNGSTINQLEYLQSVGIINSFDASQISTIPNYKDEAITLEERARAYLDMNCAHCHNPSAWVKSAKKKLDFRYETPLNESRIQNDPERIKRIMEKGEMPYLGITVTDDKGIDLIIEYINSL